MNYTTSYIGIYLFILNKLRKLIFICFETRTDLVFLAEIQTYNFISSAASQRQHGIFGSLKSCIVNTVTIYYSSSFATKKGYINCIYIQIMVL